MAGGNDIKHMCSIRIVLCVNFCASFIFQILLEALYSTYDLVLYYKCFYKLCQDYLHYSGIYYKVLLNLKLSET